MAAKVTVTQGRVYTKIKDELAETGLDIPSGTATLTNQKALANMSTAGSALFEVDGVDYAIMIVLNS